MTERIHGMRVLLVDDDPEVVWRLGKHLTRAGCSVVTCGDGEEAIGELELRTFDTLITDIQMPHLSGMAVIDWVQANRAELRVIVISSYDSAAMRELAQRKGVAAFLQKPVDCDLVLRVLCAPEPRDSFSGTVDQIDLFDYVQLIVLSRRQAVVDVVSRDGDRGRLYVDKGVVAHAICGPLEGEEAFYRCLAFDGGSFTSLPWEAPDRVSIEARPDHLLMEAARIKDEKSASQGRGPVSTFPPTLLDEDLETAFRGGLGKDPSGGRTQ